MPPAQRRVEGLLTYVYHLFPNVLITVLSRHTNVVILEPLAVEVRVLPCQRAVGAAEAGRIRLDHQRGALFELGA